MKKKITKTDWQKIGEKTKEITKLYSELSRLMSNKLPKTYYYQKFDSASNSFGKLKSHLDDLVCRDIPDQDATKIFYGNQQYTSVIAESLHLIESNKERCRVILAQETRDANDIADFLISLHLVLELSLNGFFRDIIVNNLQKTVDKAKIVENLDKISFIDKSILFIYMEKYNFEENPYKADEYHSIIGKLKDFAGIRNILMHGSMIGSFLDDYSNKTIATNILTHQQLSKQIKKYKDIMEGMEFYLNHLKNCRSNKQDLKNMFLDTNFLS